MPKIVDHEAHRCELLRASFKVAARVGYGPLSMKQLAQSLNISTGSIYHYFENKEDWFVSLIYYYSTEIFESLSREIPRDASRSEKLRLLLAHMERRKETYGDMINVASDFVRIPKADEQHGALELGLASERLSEYFAELFETDELTSRALVSYLLGVIVANRLDPRGTNANEHLLFVRALLESRSSECQGTPG